MKLNGGSYLRKETKERGVYFMLVHPSPLANRGSWNLMGGGGPRAPEVNLFF